jgi:hypothetical protein
VPVVIKVVMKKHKEMLIEFAYGIDIGEEEIDLLWGHDFGVEEFKLEVTDNNA